MAVAVVDGPGLTELSGALLDANVACRGVLESARRMRLSHGLRTFSTSHLQSLRSQDLHSLGRTPTPYGTLIQRDTVPGATGNIEIEYISPQAWLYHAAETCPAFSAFLSECIDGSRDGALRIAIYVDKATPGNDKRPDAGRSSECVYWTILEYPSWYRSRADGWTTFSYVRKNDMKEVGFSDSMLLKWVMSRFVGSKCWGLDKVGIRVNLNGHRRHVTARFAVFLADFEAHVNSFSFKGAAGSVPCPKCRNVVGRCEYFDDDPDVLHIWSSSYEKMQLRTHEELKTIIDHLSD
eukprot:9481100-Pyramimonas_sp.AAC.1